MLLTLAPCFNPVPLPCYALPCPVLRALVPCFNRVQSSVRLVRVGLEAECAANRCGVSSIAQRLSQRFGQRE